jgi:hypothetical protein
MEKKRSVGVTIILLLALPLACFAQDAATKATPKYEEELSKEQIIEAAKSKAEELGFNLEKMTVFYDEGNQKLKEHLKRRGVSVYNRESKEWKPEVGTTPEEEYPLLAGRDYQAVYFAINKEFTKGGDLWVFIDRDTAEVITYVMGK